MLTNLMAAAAGLMLACAGMTSTAKSATDCTIQSCRNGGNIYQCYAKIRSEYESKRRSCGRVELSSGVSSYAMATGLPKVCIKSSASIGIHRPYFRKTLKAAAWGSTGSQHYFGKIKQQSLAYFVARGGKTREGYANAAFMIHVPAQKTGLPICL